MTKEELWKVFVDKNPSFAEPESRLSITGSGVRKMFDTVWEKAHDLGFKNGKAWTEMKKPKEKTDALWEKMFGSKRP